MALIREAYGNAQPAPRPAPRVTPRLSTPEPQSVPRWDDPLAGLDFSSYIAPAPITMNRLGLTTMKMPDLREMDNSAFLNEQARGKNINTALDAVMGKQLSSSGSTKGLDSGFASAIAKMNADMAAAGLGNFSITSGFRSYAQQQALYEKYLAGKGNKAAKPGRSFHERGLAVDINWSQLNQKQRDWIRKNYKSYGPFFQFDPKGEPWHFSWGRSG